ncbi:MAG TPA: AraC family transcriptional regulator [bacterium]|nr:AraC family transcriptional regulator [bacterium]
MHHHRFKDYTSAKEMFHLAKITLGNEWPRIGLHRHDFAEFFWIDGGKGAHLVNGENRPLYTGDVVLIRPEDVHGFKTADKCELAIVNFAFPAETLGFLKDRYFRGNPGFWGGDGSLPLQLALNSHQYSWLEKRVYRLTRGPRTLFETERFLLSFLEMLSWNSVGEIPQWLHRACDLIYQPKHFVHGTSELASLSGMTPEHVSRMLKKHFGQTPTEIVNTARLEYAASKLLMSNESVLDICLECGFRSLSHFYKLFHTRYALSPQQYRTHHQSVLGSKLTLSEDQGQEITP